MTSVPVADSAPPLLEGYRRFVGDGPVRLLESLARTLAGHRITMVNSTAAGGGVAEILHRLVGLLNELDVPTRWEVLPGDARFHAITKTIHNALHGAPGRLTPEDRAHYRETNRRAAEQLELDGDLVLIHDPQPAALASLRRRPGQHWAWRCHIDLSRADPEILEFVLSEVSHYDAAIFSHASFVPSLPIPGFLVAPSIDPLSPKNAEMTEDEIDAELAPFELPKDVPLVTQISRFDRLKDPFGVIQAFRLTRRRERAHLVLAGGSADDDPEGAEVLAEVQAMVAGDGDISVLLLRPDAHRTINALQRRSTVVIQKSLREGFGLTVSEALWKRRPVVAGAVGGIPLQVLHERTGLLVESVEGCAYQLTRLLRDSGLRRRLGREGREHVRDNFLHTREARDYVALFAHRLLAGAASAPVTPSDESPAA